MTHYSTRVLNVVVVVVVVVVVKFALLDCVLCVR